MKHLSLKNIIASGSILVAASMAGNVLNYAYNAFLARNISLTDFGTISVVSGILGLIQIPLSSYAYAVSFQTARLNGKHGGPVREFWISQRVRAMMPAFVISVIWFCLSPVFAVIYNTGSILPFIITAPYIGFGLIAGIDAAYISGNLKFSATAVSLITEALSRFLLTIIFVHFSWQSYMYAVIPLSGVSIALVNWLLARSIKTVQSFQSGAEDLKFPRKFFVSSMLVKLSISSFLTFDLMLAKHFLSGPEAGKYALLALGGKIVFFIGTLITQFILPIVAQYEGAGKNPATIFRIIMGLTTLAILPVVLIVGVFSPISMPFLFGVRAIPVIPYMPFYAMGMAALAIGNGIVSYYQSRKKYALSLLGFILAFMMTIAIAIKHDTIADINIVVVIACFVYLFLALFYAAFENGFLGLSRLPGDFFGLFSSKTNKPASPLPDGKLRILIFNWRDEKHVWAGGAETYVHEIAERWILEGHSVTLFCGNDAKHSRYESINGVDVIRRGGFYMVYFWAVVYYLFRFRNRFDVIVDAENGIPFFTPLFVKEPSVLLIHHIHQDVFRKHLPFPLSYFAMFLEAKVMPIVYRNCRIVTTSDSSRYEILKLGFTTIDRISIVHPGINPKDYRKLRKTKHPSILYFGRLTPWKNVDILIKAFAHILSIHPDSRLTIAGEGVARHSLERLVRKMKLQNSVTFTGRISDQEKIQLLGTHWFAVQPSLVEGWGITVIEANACGTPVIASCVNGLKDSVVHGRTGILTEPKSIGNLILAINLLIENVILRRQLSNEAYRWAKQFTWDNAAADFRTVFMAAVSETAERQTTAIPLNYSKMEVS